MFTTTLIALALAAGGPSDPSRGLLVDAMPATAAAVSAAPTPKAAKPTIYCVKDVLTGSRLARTTCLTRKAWLARDFDPLASSGR